MWDPPATLPCCTCKPINGWAVGAATAHSCWPASRHFPSGRVTPKLRPSALDHLSKCEGMHLPWSFPLTLFPLAPPPPLPHTQPSPIPQGTESAQGRASASGRRGPGRRCWTGALPVRKDRLPRAPLLWCRSPRLSPGTGLAAALLTGREQQQQQGRPQRQRRAAGSHGQRGGRVCAAPGAGRDAGSWQKCLAPAAERVGVSRSSCAPAIKGCFLPRIRSPGARAEDHAPLSIWPEGRSCRWRTWGELGPVTRAAKRRADTGGTL